jgi:hypothetical protein
MVVVQMLLDCGADAALCAAGGALCEAWVASSGGRARSGDLTIMSRAL